jgi:AraC-like DNA-binding protein
MIFSIVLLGYNKGYKSANRFLAGVFFFSSLFFLTTFEFLFNKNVNIIAVFQTVIPSFYFLICPFSYFYIRSILKDNSRLSKFDFLHFLPFAIAFLGTMPLLFSSWENKLKIAENVISNYWFNPTYRINLFLSPNQNKILKGLQILVYVILNWYTFHKYKLQLKQRILHTRQYIVIRNWLLIFCSFLSLEAVFLILGVYNVIILETKALFLERYYLYLTIMSLGFLMLNFTLLLIPQILYGLPIERLSDVNMIESASEDDLPIRTPELLTEVDKVTPSFYSKVYLDQIEQWIKKTEQDALFINPDFKMEDISKISGIPIHHLAYFFANFTDFKFSEWRNNLRISYSTKLMNEGAMDDHSFEGIAQLCGFSSRQTFIRAFKNKIGKTPSDYYRELKLN